MKKQVLFRFAEAAQDQRNCEMTAVLSIGRRNVMSVKNGFTKNVRISQLKPNK
jgi:hypothetical protein